jgi:hypothetical protein
MVFCTSIHCMDGRIQEPLIRYLKASYNVTYVDVVTEPGPCGILAYNRDEWTVKSIRERVDISVFKHGSRLIAVSGHCDCAGNPAEDATQEDQVMSSVKLLENWYPDVGIIGLWVDSSWSVRRVPVR